MPFACLLTSIDRATKFAYPSIQHAQFSMENVYNNFPIVFSFCMYFFVYRWTNFKVPISYDDHVSRKRYSHHHHQVNKTNISLLDISLSLERSLEALYHAGQRVAVMMMMMMNSDVALHSLLY